MLAVRLTHKMRRMEANWLFEMGRGLIVAILEAKSGGHRTGTWGGLTHSQRAKLLEFSSDHREVLWLEKSLPFSPQCQAGVQSPMLFKG